MTSKFAELEDVSGHAAIVTGMTSDGPRPFQRLDDRLAGKPIDEVLLPGVPDHLEKPVRQWISGALSGSYGGVHDELARAAMVSLGWPIRSTYGYSAELGKRPQEELLVAVDALLQLNREYGAAIRILDIQDLDRTLRQGRSAAVHAAVLLVQWLTSGALRKKPDRAPNR